MFYAPSLEQISIENNRGLRLIDTQLDSVTIVVENGSLVIEPSNQIARLVTQVSKNSKVDIGVPYLVSGDYMLQDSSQIRNRTKRCDSLAIQGDMSSIVELALPVDSSRSQYGMLKYNAQIGQVVLETSRIQDIQGNPDRLKLVMDISGFERVMRTAIRN